MHRRKLPQRPLRRPSRLDALDYVRAHEAAFGLDDGDLASLSARSSYTSIDGVTHVTWQQAVDGIESYDSYRRVNLTEDGRLINLGGAPVSDLRLDTTTPALSATDALAVARRNVDGSALATTPETEYEGAKLTAFADGDGAATLAWRVRTEARNTIVYEVVVDAASGRVLARHSLTDFLNQAHDLGEFPNRR